MERKNNDGPSRRDVLRATLAASAGLLISGCRSMPTTDRSGAAGKRVVVIGAGFSGLACAHELRAAGYDVQVLEARNRIGGRVLTFRDFVPGRIVEGGAELIGSNHPAWCGYAERFGLKFLDVTDDKDATEPVSINGRLLSAKEVEQLHAGMDKAFKTMCADAADVDADAPWTAPSAAAWDARSSAQWLNDQPVDPLAAAGIAIELVANNGMALERQSYLGNLAQIKGGGLDRYWTDSEVYRCQGGNDQLATALAGAIGLERIRTGAPVVVVRTTERGAVVITADGAQYAGDEVVMTVPPSVWGKIAFDPPLPRTLRPQMGVNVKYMSHLRASFWRDGRRSPDALSDGDVSMTWDQTDNQGPGPAALCAFSGGPAAQRVRARTPKDRDDAYRAALEALLPGYAANLEKTRFMDWPSDPWTAAGYSFPAPGQVTTVGPALRRGLGRLHFAGEHTCYAFAGYMEGALNSGASAAKRIAQRDGVFASV